MSRILHYLLYHKFSVYFLTAAVVLAVVANEQMIKVVPRLDKIAKRIASKIVAKKYGLLRDGKDTLLHAWFGNGIIGTGAVAEVVSLKDDFTLEVIVRPSKVQSTYSHIMGNHPGHNYFEGFAIQQDGNNQNVYTFGFGNGKQWLPSVRFELPPEKWSYLAIIVERNIIKVFRNGSLEASADATNSIKNSGMPIEVGNWVNGDRPFNGFIREVRVLESALSEEEIERNWQFLQESLM